MSYVEREEEEKIIKKQERLKLENPIKTMLIEDTTVETAQDIIDRDTDSARRNEFKKAEEILQALEPEENKKKKSKKSKEKEEFDKNLAFIKQNQLLGKEIQEKNKQKEQQREHKQMERGE